MVTARRLQPGWESSRTVFTSISIGAVLLKVCAIVLRRRSDQHAMRLARVDRGQQERPDVGHRRSLDGVDGCGER